MLRHPIAQNQTNRPNMKSIILCLVFVLAYAGGKWHTRFYAIGISEDELILKIDEKCYHAKKRIQETSEEQAFINLFWKARCTGILAQAVCLEF